VVTLTPPTGLTAIAGNAQVVLSWSASANAASYNVYVGASSGHESATPIATGVSGTTYTSTSLTNNTAYFYKVAAVAGASVSALSNEASATPQGSALQAPSGLTAVSGNGSVALSWMASSGAVTYNVYDATTPGGETLVASGITAASYSVTGLVNGTEYYFYVVALAPSGSSLPSNETAAIPAPSLPSPPTGLQATAGNEQVALSWTGVSGATGYNVYRGTVPGGEDNLVQTNNQTTAFTDTSLANGTKYYFIVKTISAAGESAPSNEANATPVSPEAPYGGTPASIPGTLQTVNYDLGGEGFGFQDYNISTDNNGGSYRVGGIDIIQSAGVWSIDKPSPHSWLRYTVNVAQAGTYQVTFHAPNTGPIGDDFRLSG
jgi:cellulose 1,4-beta-cellobiosidase